jgi:hypothetical protein
VEGLIARRIRGRRQIARRASTWAAVALLATQLVGVPAVAAADPVSFGTPTASSTFGKSIVFEQPVTISGTPTRVEILITTPGAIGPEVIPLPSGEASGSSLTYTMDMAGGGAVPNTTFTASWRVVDADGKAWRGPPVSKTYDDDRFTWKTLNGKVVRVHWYEGGQALGQKAVKIGDDAIAAAADLLGVTESDPIDFFIYADQKAFYDALGPGTRENVGGQAHPDIRTLFALIAPDEIDAGWIESVVPHELTHVVFATAVDNPYHEPPHWLNEGLAVYLSDGYDASFKAIVQSAAGDGSLMPLDGLAGAFPTTQDRFFLAYGESVSAVDRIVRVNGRDALVKLIRSYRDGVSDDDAFKAALGTDVAGFEADWLADLGAKPPTRLGPQPAPGGPLPAGWSGPRPNPSFEVVASAGPGSPTAPGPTGSPTTTDWFIRIGAVVAGLLLIAAFASVLIRRRRPAMAAPVATDGRPTPVAPDRAAAPSWVDRDWSLPRPDDGAPPDATRAAEPDAAPPVAPTPPPADPADPPTGS